jgi:hypothetical protein
MRAGKTTRGQNRTNTPRRPGVLHRRDNTPVSACQDLLARVQCIERAHLPLDLDKFLKDQYLFLAQSGR